MLARAEVSAPHPLETFEAEHKIILEILNELGSLVESLKNTKSFESMAPDLEKLKNIAHLLVEAESHHQREEEALFPRLEGRDIVEPPAMMKLDHADFAKKRNILYQVARNPQDYQFSEYQKIVIEVGEYLTKNLKEHIAKEDSTLYQIALQLLSDEEWREVKEICDRLGYWCVTS